MNPKTAQYIETLGINPTTVPEGMVNLLKASTFSSLSPNALAWGQNPHNSEALAYLLETEFDPQAGIALRNLHMDKDKKDHLTVTKAKGVYWHNWTPALPYIWDTGTAVLVEGPKDARVAWSCGLKNVLAYLGSAPHRNHLKSLWRYCKSIIWLPDNDGSGVEIKAREKASNTLMTKMGFTVWVKHLPTKDFGDLAFDPRRDTVVKEIQEMVKFCAFSRR